MNTLPSVCSLTRDPLGKRDIRVILSVLLSVFTFALGASCYAAPDNQAARYYEDALTRYEKGDINGAIVQLKNARQLDKTMLPVQVLLGKALMASGDPVAADVALVDALRLGVNRSEVVVPLAQAYLAQGKQKLLLEQAQFNPAGLPSGLQQKLLALRASAYSDLGDMIGAMRTIDDARALDAKAVDVWLAEVPIRIRMGNFNEASAAADRALTLDPNSPEGWYQKGTVLHVRGDLKGALAAYDRALRIEPHHIEARVARAGLYIDLLQHTEAAKDVAELQRLAPMEPRAAYLKALLAERDNKPTAMRDALKEITSLIDPAPLNFIRYRPQLLMLNGLAHFGLNEREKAKFYLEAMQKSQGSGAAATKLLAQIYISESDMSRAISLLEDYLKSHPTDVQAMALLASAHMAQGHYYKATTLMQDALRSQDTPELRTNLGLSLIGGGQTGDALGQLETAFRKDPKQTQAGSALIGLYLRSGQANKAVAVAETLVKQQPSNPGFFNLLGMAQAAAGNATAARTAFEQAIKLDDTLTPAKLNLARLDIADKAYDAAAQRLGALLKADERNTDALFELAALAVLRGQMDAAQRWLEKADDFEGPRKVRAGLALVDLHLQNRQPTRALEVAKRLSAKASDNVSVLLAYGRSQLAVGDAAAARATLSEAARFADYNASLQLEVATLQLAANNPQGAGYSLEKALSGQPDYLPAMALMTDLDLRQGNPAQAEKRARQIVEKNPKRAVGYSLLGDVALARNQPAAALESYRRAHQIEPSTDTLLRLFRTLLAQDNVKPAFQLIEQWIKTHPEDIQARRALADAYARTGNFPSARSAYEVLLKAAPDNADVINNLANVLLHLNDAGAVKMAELALTKDPNNADIIDTLGWAHFKNGNTDRALPLLRDARLRNPNSPDIRYHLAAVLAKTGRKSEARDELETALKSGRAFEQAREADSLLRTLK